MALAQVISPIIMDIDDYSLSFEFERLIENEPIPRNISVNAENAGEESNEICKFFLKGTCVKGNACPYKHTKGERAVVCKHWLRGLCKKGDSCEFLHEYDLSKMPECYFFSKFGM